MTTASAISVLIVEDSATQAEQLRSVLEGHGNVVRIAGNGREALEVIADNPPTLVISDIVMPEMDGYQLCAAIRSHGETRDLPVLLLTALSSPKDILRALECGANSFISKPYSSEFLVARLEDLLASLRRPRGEDDGCEVVFGNERFRITAGRQRILDLLVCTYESTVIKNRELLETQKELRESNLRLEIALDEVTEAQQKALALAEENQRLYDEMKHLSLHDPLTGLPNRRMLDISLDTCLARSVRFGSVFCVLLMDIDFFKKYNDTYGHDAGDRILIRLAATLKRCTRMTDLAVRYGGEEFIILMGDTSREGGIAFAERVRAAVQADVGVTVSIGVAQYQSGVTLTALIKAADDALYLAKDLGRNRVESVTPEV
jgi:diguanylate cyclase (GGDEF)-like protein